MEQLVVDSNIIVSSFLESEDFHERAQEYINGLENGAYTFHLPMVVPVEVMSAISRRARQNRLALVATWKQNLIDWERDGIIILYPLDRKRMENAVTTAEQHLLRGADSVVAALAEELDMPVKTFDKDILARFLKASV
jgi:predicted nucleic acid-binding protein